MSIINNTCLGYLNSFWYSLMTFTLNMFMRQSWSSPVFWWCTPWCNQRNLMCCWSFCYNKIQNVNFYLQLYLNMTKSQLCHRSVWITRTGLLIGVWYDNILMSITPLNRFTSSVYQIHFVMTCSSPIAYLVVVSSVWATSKISRA